MNLPVRLLGYGNDHFKPNKELTALNRRLSTIKEEKLFKY